MKKLLVLISGLILFSFCFDAIAGGIVPGLFLLKPNYLENEVNWPFLWGETSALSPKALLIFSCRMR